MTDTRLTEAEAKVKTWATSHLVIACVASFVLGAILVKLIF